MKRLCKSEQTTKSQKSTFKSFPQSSRQGLTKKLILSLEKQRQENLLTYTMHILEPTPESACTAFPLVKSDLVYLE